MHIEFTGLPGVGKSTIYKHLVNNRSKDDSLITSREAQFMQKYDRNKCAIILRSIISNLDKFINIPRVITNILTPHISDNTLKIFCNNNTDFIEHIINNFATNNKDGFSHIYSFEMLLNNIRQISLVEELSLNNPVIFDESLIQRSFTIHSLEKQNKNLFINYFNLCPVPKILVYIKGETKLIKERLYHRNNGEEEINLNHKKLVESNLFDEFINTGIDILSKRGSKILILNADTSINEQIFSIQHFITDTIP